MRKILLAALVIFAQAAFAGTEFAIINDSQNVYLGKNRDMVPDRQGVIVYVPESANKYVALVSKTLLYNNKKVANEWYLRAGINEHKLAISTLFAADPFLEKKQVPDLYNDGSDFAQMVLANYKDVKEVLEDLPKLVEKYPYPEFYMIADNDEAAYIEVGLNKQYKVKYSFEEPLVHTNNYRLFTQVDYTKYFSPTSSSLKRLNRMEKLLASLPEHYTADNLLAIMNDHNAGDNDSITRLGNPVTKINSSRTTSQFLAQIPKNADGIPVIFINLLNVNESYKFNLDNLFWSKYTKNTIISLN